MLLVTALVAVLLTVFVKYPVLIKISLVLAIPALVLIALFHAANIVSSESHPRLSLVFWSAFGAYFWAFSIVAWKATHNGHGVVRSVENLIWIMVACGAICVFRAFQRAFKLSRTIRPSNIESLDDGDSI